MEKLLLFVGKVFIDRNPTYLLPFSLLIKSTEIVILFQDSLLASKAAVSWQKRR